MLGEGVVTDRLEPGVCEWCTKYGIVEEMGNVTQVAVPGFGFRQLNIDRVLSGGQVFARM